MADRGEALLDARRGELARLAARSRWRRAAAARRRSTPRRRRVAPGQELGAGAGVGAARVRVADGGGEEFEEARARLVAGGGDQRGKGSEPCCYGGRKRARSCVEPSALGKRRDIARAVQHPNNHHSIARAAGNRWRRGRGKSRADRAQTASRSGPASGKRRNGSHAAMIAAMTREAMSADASEAMREPDFGEVGLGGIGQAEGERPANSFLPRSMMRSASKSCTRPSARSARPLSMSAFRDGQFLQLQRALHLPVAQRLAHDLAARRVVAALDRALDDGGHVGRQGDRQPFDLGHGRSSC